jgi:hypothetical protein
MKANHHEVLLVPVAANNNSVKNPINQTKTRENNQQVD